eukprot:TRINITY_DN30913_c0_g1_i1.p1 TRINITY_DN30913_c0_g1~~TRINITY_DN30913_c0_g1_i1.p1  ORF type:complete len:283 (-),score=41.49 TRINITY_DN30913_c0_g1_i1:96-944(-)
MAMAMRHIVPLLCICLVLESHAVGMGQLRMTGFRTQGHSAGTSSTGGGAGVSEMIEGVGANDYDEGDDPKEEPPSNISSRRPASQVENLSNLSEPLISTIPPEAQQVQAALQGTAPDGRALEHFFRVTRNSSGSDDHGAGPGWFARLSQLLGGTLPSSLLFSSGEKAVAGAQSVPTNSTASDTVNVSRPGKGEGLGKGGESPAVAAEASSGAPPKSWFKETFGREASEILTLLVILVVAGVISIWSYKGQQQFEAMNRPSASSTRHRSNPLLRGWPVVVIRD